MVIAHHNPHIFEIFHTIYFAKYILASKSHHYTFLKNTLYHATEDLYSTGLFMDL